MTQAPIVLPITNGGNFARKAGFTIALEGSGSRTTGVIRCDQPRSLDLIARDARRLEAVPDFILDAVSERLAAILDLPGV